MDAVQAVDSGPSPSRLGCREDWGSLLLCYMPSSPVPPREPGSVTKEPSAAKTRAAQKLSMPVLGMLLLGHSLPACLPRVPTSSLSLGRSRVSQFYYRMLIEKAAFVGRCFLPKSLSSAKKRWAYKFSAIHNNPHNEKLLNYGQRNRGTSSANKRLPDDVPWISI